MSDETAAAKTARVRALCSEIMPLLSGVDPDTVGGVLGTLVGTYISGHNPRLRAATKAALYDMVDQVVAIMDARRDNPWPTRQ